MKLLNDADTKQCNVCNVVKELKDFHPNKECDRGVVGTCRECTKVRKKDWYEATKKERQIKARKQYRKNKLIAIGMHGDVCLDCGKTYPFFVYQFHHIDPHSKEDSPANIRGSKKFFEEIQKCVMLCANCHMIRHFGEYE